MYTYLSSGHMPCRPRTALISCLKSTLLCARSFQLSSWPRAVRYFGRSSIQRSGSCHPSGGSWCSASSRTIFRQSLFGHTGWAVCPLYSSTLLFLQDCWLFNLAIHFLDFPTPPFFTFMYWFTIFQVFFL